MNLILKTGTEWVVLFTSSHVRCLSCSMFFFLIGSPYYPEKRRDMFSVVFCTPSSVFHVFNLFLKLTSLDTFLPQEFKKTKCW